MVKKSLIGILAAVVLIPVVVTASWMLMEGTLAATSGPGFCTTCHTMEPFARTYRADVHGGDNPRGLAAKCTDCHLRHDSLAAHLWTKARFGLHDIWAQLTYDLTAIDWQAGLAERESYVFDSGCLKCHRDLEHARGNNPAFVAHRPYFLGEIDRTCVSCHPHVGHQGLAAALPPSPATGADP
ncbi:cytochrome c3 family protein [Thiohalocapsa halophila]|uniref:cytochrome c3 family protein n=1 Tax=Thiohalocapsa halophila TaxID=69359 RepID=UPI001A922F91|nr:NapC/NirT family cytochrome c [Thiohalocapsa halophila]